MVNLPETILTGLRPTGTLHLGNYFGAIAPLLKLQETHKVYLMVADLHALTTLDDRDNLSENTLKTAALYIAFGIDPNKTTIFVQSHIPAHAELATLLGMITPLSMVELNPVYKEMLAAHPTKRTFGLLGYPVLQAADILLYQANAVPVGRDQAPHIELTREIARKFNTTFGDTFTLPKTLLSEAQKILSLKDPTKKMSKSHGEASYVGLLDDAATVLKKVRTAVTDSDGDVAYDPEKKAGLANLLSLHALVTASTPQASAEHFAGNQYNKIKQEIAEVISSFLSPGQQRYEELMKDPESLKNILSSGNTDASKIANKSLKSAYDNVGLYQ